MRTLISRATASVSAFTLVEMLVVLAIVAATAAVAIPRLTKTETSAAAASREAVVALRRARAEAMTRSADTRLVFDLAARALTQNRQVLTRWPASVSVSIEGAASEQDGAAFAVRFYPDGGSSGLAVRFADRRGENALRVSWLTGAVDAGR